MGLSPKAVRKPQVIHEIANIIRLRHCLCNGYLARLVKLSIFTFIQRRGSKVLSAKDNSATVSEIRFCLTPKPPNTTSSLHLTCETRFGGRFDIMENTKGRAPANTSLIG